MNNAIKNILALSLILSSMTVMAGRLELREGAIEIEPSLYYLGKSLSGKIEGQVCGGCETITLTITPDTQAFDDKKQVSLASKVSTTKKPALVFFDLKTRNVTRLIWL